MTPFQKALTSAFHYTAGIGSVKSVLGEWCGLYTDAIPHKPHIARK